MIFWKKCQNGYRRGKKLRIVGWHGNNATGDDLLGHCVKSVFLERAEKKGIKLELVDQGKCDLIVIGGGTILGVDSMRLYELVKDIRAPLVIFGGGFRREKRDIGDENRKHTHYLFSRAELAGVRGYISQQFLLHNQIPMPEVIGDPGLLFKPDSSKRKIDGQHKIGVFVRSMGKSGESQYVDNIEVQRQIAEVCDWLAKEGNKRFYFFSFAENPHDSDLEGINSVISFMKNKDAVEIIPYSEDFIQQCSMIGDMDYVVSQRLHPVVLAWLMKRPCVGFDYQFGKTADFMNSIGMDEFVIRTDEFSLEAYKVKFERLVAERDLIIEQSQRSIRHWKERLVDFVDRSLAHLL